jgi:uncharacterized membrane protein YphA (DoxX/SURF4 family)
MVLPGGIAVVIGLFGKLNAYLLLPVLSVYFALSLASSLMPDKALSGICKAIKETIIFAMGFFTTIAAGLLSLQKIVAGASENVVTGAAKFTLGSVCGRHKGCSRSSRRCGAYDPTWTAHHQGAALQPVI